MIALIVSILLLDRVTKLLAERLLSLHGSVPVIKGVFHLTLVHNTGAAFGLLKNSVALLVVVTAAVMWLLWVSLLKAHRNPRMAFYRLPLSLIFGGALGNLIDRVFLGYVIDFLDFRIWPVFNVADSAITIGAVILGISIVFNKPGNE